VFLSSRAVFQGCSSQKCAAVQGRAEKGCCLITMIYIQPCIEKRYTLSAEQGFADRQRFFVFLSSRAVFQGCSSQQSPEKCALYCKSSVVFGGTFYSALLQTDSGCANFVLYC
jgi:hypothetical protein